MKKEHDSNPDGALGLKNIVTLLRLRVQKSPEIHRQELHHIRVLIFVTSAYFLEPIRGDGMIFCRKRVFPQSCGPRSPHHTFLCIC